MDEVGADDTITMYVTAGVLVAEAEGKEEGPVDDTGVGGARDAVTPCVPDRTTVADAVTL